MDLMLYEIGAVWESAGWPSLVLLTDLVVVLLAIGGVMLVRLALEKQRA